MVTQVIGVPNGVPTETRKRSRGERFGREVKTMLRQPTLVLSILFMVLIILGAFFPGWFTHYNPIVGVPADSLSAPSAKHWFGTDIVGRDSFSRVLYGSATSLQASFIAICVGVAGGALIGLFAGYFGGFLDNVLMRFIDVILAIPGLLLSLVVIAVLGFGAINVAIAVGIGSVATFSRLMRAEVLRVRTSVFVEAARVCGGRWYSVVFRHVLPNSWKPILVLAVLDFGSAILGIAALNFLGFGAAPPAPEWGALVSEGRAYIATAWWLTTIPGLIITLVVVSVNRIGRYIDRNTRTEL